jgi:hypothetical protein
MRAKNGKGPISNAMNKTKMSIEEKLVTQSQTQTLICE